MVGSIEEVICMNVDSRYRKRLCGKCFAVLREEVEKAGGIYENR